MLSQEQPSKLVLFWFSFFLISNVGIAAGTDSLAVELNKTRNLVTLFEQKAKLIKKFKKNGTLSTMVEEDICRYMRSQPHEVLQSKLMLGDRPNVGEFIGALFFPHHLFANTLKTNFNQLSFFERALILVSADFGFKLAKNILILGSYKNVNLETISTEQHLSQVLSIPFATENGMVVEKAKEILNDTAKQNSFYSNLEAEVANASSATVHLARRQLTTLLNAGYIYKFLGRSDLATNLFQMAVAQGSRRGLIEHGFMILTQDQSKADDFISNSLHLRIKAYALWKLAQYHRYGISTPRDLVRANEYYLASLAENTTNEFPEISYDAGDFTEYFAYSQIDPEKRVHALKQALEHYKKATEGGIDIEGGIDKGYEKQIEILKKINNLEPITNIQNKIEAIAARAAERGFIYAGNLLEAAGLSIDRRENFLALEQHVNNYENYQKAILRDKCLSF